MRKHFFVENNAQGKGPAPLLRTYLYLCTELGRGGGQGVIRYLFWAELHLVWGGASAPPHPPSLRPWSKHDGALNPFTSMPKAKNNCYKKDSNCSIHISKICSYLFSNIWFCIFVEHVKIFPAQSGKKAQSIFPCFGFKSSHNLLKISEWSLSMVFTTICLVFSTLEDAYMSATLCIPKLDALTCVVAVEVIAIRRIEGLNAILSSANIL